MEALNNNQQLELFKPVRQMTLKKATKLNKVLVGISNKIHEINYGGCGIFAEYLYQAASNLGYRSKLVCLNSIGDRTRKQHLSNLKKIAKQDMHSVFAYNHICLQIGNYYFDCNHFELVNTSGIFNIQYKKLGHLSISQLQYLNALEWKWNDLYDRGQNKRLLRLLARGLQQL